MKLATAAYLLAALCAICATVLVALGDKPPSELWMLAGTALGGGAGISVQKAVP